MVCPHHSRVIADEGSACSVSDEQQQRQDSTDGVQSTDHHGDDDASEDATNDVRDLTDPLGDHHGNQDPDSHSDRGSDHHDDQGTHHHDNHDSDRSVDHRSNQQDRHAYKVNTEAKMSNPWKVTKKGHMV